MSHTEVCATNAVHTISWINKNLTWHELMNLQFHDYLLVVSRIVARSEKHNMYMLLDVNTEIYPINRKERFLLALSPSLVLNTKVKLMLIQFVVPCFIIATIKEIYYPTLIYTKFSAWLFVDPFNKTVLSISTHKWSGLWRFFLVVLTKKFIIFLLSFWYIRFKNWKSSCLNLCCLYLAPWASQGKLRMIRHWV